MVLTKKTNKVDKAPKGLGCSPALVKQGAVKVSAVANVVTSVAGMLEHLAGVSAGLINDDFDSTVVFSVGAVDGEADLAATLLGELLGEGEGGHGWNPVAEGPMPPMT